MITHYTPKLSYNLGISSRQIRQMLSFFIKLKLDYVNNTLKLLCYLLLKSSSSQTDIFT